MHAIPQLLASTILLGGIYALIAVGLTLIFGVMRIVNFAHGEFLMLGMYLAFWAFTLLGLDPYVTLVLGLPVIFGGGWLSYRLVMRPVIHASHNVQVFTTVGLSIALQALALVLWSADSQFVRTGYYAVVVRFGGVALNLAQLAAFAVAVLFTSGYFRLHALVVHRQGHAGHRAGPPRRRPHGDRHRPRLRPDVGGRHHVRRGGRRGARPDLSRVSVHRVQFVLIAYVAVVLGGLGDMVGALIASLVVAFVEVVVYVIGTAWKEVLYLLLFIAILVIRPAGLFGQRGAEVIGT